MGLSIQSFGGINAQAETTFEFFQCMPYLDPRV